MDNRPSKNNRKRRKNLIDRDSRLINDKLYSIIDNYFAKFLAIKDRIRENNNFIYWYVKNVLTVDNAILQNSNYKDYLNRFKAELSNILLHNNRDRIDLIDSILKKILKSIIFFRK